MMPVAQMDPASLTMWLDFSVCGRHPHWKAMQDAVLAAAGLDNDRAIESVENLPAGPARTRCVSLVSSIWHEQRHFLDLLLTNFGCFRVRQFTMLYEAVPFVFQEANQRGELLIPVIEYDDPVRLAMLGHSASENLRAVAKNLRDRLKMNAEDQDTQEWQEGTRAQIGGEAQLEALAWLCQVAAAGTHFPGAAVDALLERPASIARDVRYQWIMDVAESCGLLSSRWAARNTPSIAEQISSATSHASDFGPACALLYGALAVRRWGQKQTLKGNFDSGIAASRLTGLLKSMLPDLLVRPYSTLEAWEKVNDIASDLWGRTIIEETRQDLRLQMEHQAEFKEKFAGFDTPIPWLVSFLDELIKLRAGLLIDLINSPQTILDPHEFALRGLPLLQPIPIVVAPGGAPGLHPNGLDVVFGYSNGTNVFPTSYKELPLRDDEAESWWWAATPVTSGARKGISFKDRTACLYIVSEMAPIAKLLTFGFKHRTMIGPELESAWKRLSLDFELKCDPYFLYPPTVSNGIEDFLFLTGNTTAMCDFCRKAVEHGEGMLVHAGFFRRSQAWAESLIDAFGGGREGRIRYQRDWTPWLLCNACYAATMEVARREGPPSPPMRAFS